MTRQEFKDYLEKLKIKYIEVKPREDWEFYQIYVEDRRTRELKDLHPRKYSNVYIPYIRVSHFDDMKLKIDGFEVRPGYLYTRENGYTCWMECGEVISKCKEYGT